MVSRRRSFWGELRQRNVVRIAALYLAASWLILQVADLVLEAFGFPAWNMRFLIAILLLGFPAALALAWIYQLTPDGIRKQTDIDEDTVRRSNGRRIGLTIAVLVTLAVGVVVVDRNIVRPVAPAGPAADDRRDTPAGSVAVMPFVNISDGPDSDYFADGLAAELLNLLADVPQLRVTSRSSSFASQVRGLDPVSIGRALNVANILEGSVRKTGDRLRISVALIDAQTGYRLWADTFDRRMADVFALQNEIASAAVDKLRVTILGGPPRARETDPDAFAAFLNGVHFYSQRSIEGYDKAERYLKIAIDIDPDYPPAWTTLSSTYLNQVVHRQLPFREGNEMAKEAAERALAIDPDYALANSARAWIAMSYERDYAASAAFYERALRLSPGNAIIIGNSSTLATELGLVERAIELSKDAITLNPISAVSYANIGAQFNRAGRPNEGAQAAAKALELTPGMPVATANLGISYLLAEQPELALGAAGQLGIPVYRYYLEALAYHSLGRRGESDRALAAMRREHAADNAFEIACVHAWRGEDDLAFEWLDRAIDDGQSTFGIKTEPMLRSLHGDPRWQPVLSRLGLSDDDLAGLTI